MTQLGNAAASVSRNRPNFSSVKTPTALSSNASMASSSSNTGECVKVAGHSNIVRADVARGFVELQSPKGPSKSFFFDSVFGENAKQFEIYDETVRGIVDSVLQGFNGTVFAYGQTGTGKTHTMEGTRGEPTQRGVIPNAIQHIFQHIAHSPPNQQFLVRASFLEIYQEEIRDLLNRSANKRLELKERPDIGVYVKDLSSFVTKSVEETEEVISVGHSNRSVGRTNMNEHSSRSHAIFVITVECSETDQDGQTHIRVGRLNLVDLAGSERQSKTGSEGQRFREATRINLSLSALGNVISALSDQNSAHIPYRDSKLTRLLQDSLGGNSKTVMIANIGPASYNFEETIGTLRYASRAKQIENKPKINEDPKDALLREFQDEIVRLKEMLEKRRRKRTEGQKNGTGQTETEEKREENEADAEREAEEYARAQQRKLGAERARLLRNGALIDEERKRILAELEERERELERERQEQLAVAAKIRAMQSKLLSGDGNLLDRTRRQEEQLRQRRTELTERRRREREMAQKLESQELEAAEIRQTFANLQQEVEAKRRKVHKLNAKLQSLRLDLQDLEGANAAERRGLEQTVLEMNKELALKWLIIDSFVPSAVAEYVRREANFDEGEQQWRLRGQGHPGTSSSTLSSDGIGGKRPIDRLNLALSPNPQAAMVDSGLGSSNGGSYGPSVPEDDEQQNIDSTTEGQTTKVPLELKRPIAFSFLRRPTCASELCSMAQLRQRLGRQKPKIGQKHSVDSPKSLPELSIHEEMLRFGCENLLTFHSLLSFPSVSSDFPRPSVSSPRASSLADPQRIVLDASRIPVLTHRRASNGGRPGSASGIRRNSIARSAILFPQQQHSQNANQIPKNGRARSVFSSASDRMALATERTEQTKAIRNQNGVRREQTIGGEKRNIGTIEGSQLEMAFPKARGLVPSSADFPADFALCRHCSRRLCREGSPEGIRTLSSPQPPAICSVTSKCAEEDFVLNFCSASAFLKPMDKSLKLRQKSQIPVLIAPKTPRNVSTKQPNSGNCLALVPYFQLGTSAGGAFTSREQLSSPAEGDEQCHADLSRNSPLFWSSALSRANCTLAKSQKGTKNCVRFRTLPAVPKPVLRMPRGDSLCPSSLSSSSCSFSISHCCLCSSSSCWLKMPEKTECQQRTFGRVQKGRIRKKRRKNGIPSELCPIRSRNCESPGATTADLALFRCAVLFSAFALFLRLVLFLF
ncbi:hypothetical protein niasHT_015770 [Heterodera trifolii]|uniref:Kinesin motor domain-containing protein n=1 Tax=Heterodera trifolii TaxID=157864 RepID=A0ABD2L4K9_9BILA